MFYVSQWLLNSVICGFLKIDLETEFLHIIEYRGALLFYRIALKREYAVHCCSTFFLFRIVIY